ncbi:MAG: mechanosensitive ion channel family protein [Acidobacteriaceae bacterium]|nr:mechanosensitive ion channel family protein [Acidobacteriaceae bacterium]
MCRKRSAEGWWTLTFPARYQGNSEPEDESYSLKRTTNKSIRATFTLRKIGAVACCFAVLAALPFAIAAPGGSNVAAQDLLQCLNQTIAWYQHVSSVEESGSFPQTTLLEDNVRQTARQVVQAAFTFARADAALLRSEKSASSASSQQGTLRQAQQTAMERVQKLQSQIDDLNAQIEKAKSRTRQTLVSQRDVLLADLNVAKQLQAAIEGMASFTGASDSAGGLMGQINLLANSDSIPAALNNSQTAPANAKPATTQVFHPESAGIMTLVTQTLSVVHARKQIDLLRDDTTNLQATVERVRNPLRVQLRAIIRQSDSIARGVGNESNPADLAAETHQLNQISSQFKTLSGTALPLGEEAMLLNSVQNGVAQWRRALSEQYRSTLEYLGIRLGGIALGIVVILLISEVLRRATFHYVREARLRRQFLLIRRFVVGLAIGIVVVIGFFSGFGSFATIAGFVTAGLAVALQNVILSVVAYFFLIGRYGLKIGDRVTVAGVTGQVIEVGLVRLYLMELAGAGADVHSTSRIAVFPNAIIFQPSALIKQAPGTAYTWHQAGIALTEENDVDQARQRLLGAVESVYKTYKGDIERQHQAFERTANFQVADPVPTVRVQFIEGGYQITIRFPAELANASEIDDDVIRALMEEINKDPRLKLANGGRPKITPLIP